MATYAITDNSGLVVNRIVLNNPSDWMPAAGYSIHAETDTAFNIGGTLIDGVYTAPPSDAPVNLPPLVPASITDRQFFQQLSVQGIITEADALASNAAVIPPPLLAIINAMPVDQQFSAKMLVSGATTFYRDNALTVTIGTAYGMTSAQIDAFFTSASML